jgi:ribosome-associated protein
MVDIPEAELTFTASRSGGPGGQHVNKVSSRITLHFDVDASPSLTAEQKATLHRRLATRINQDGVLHVVSRKHRSQFANRQAAVEHFRELIEDALTPRKPRKPTRVSKAEKQRRLEDKKRHGQIKAGRSRGAAWEG